MTTKNKKVNYRRFVAVKNDDILTNIVNRASSKDKGCTVLVPHVCSKNNFLSSKFAVELNKKFPVLKEDFQMLSKDAILGKTQFVTVFEDKQYKHSIIIANMIANQNVTKFSSRKINYAALCYCMNAVKFKTKEIKSLDENKNIEIHSPKFGCGSSGGSWSFISELIEDIWSGVDTYVYY